MASQAFLGLKNALTEVELLVASAARASNEPTRRALARAAVVMLSGHFERYIYGINEEAVDYCNRCSIVSTSLPTNLRLLHSRFALEPILAASWERREASLSEFVTKEGWLWQPASTGSLQAAFLLRWMKTPKPKEIQRHFDYWGIDEIFDRITRTAHTRSRLWYSLDSLVTKRNAIAHGELAETASWQDIKGYRGAVLDFADRTDRAFAKHLAKLCSSPPPW